MSAMIDRMDKVDNEIYGPDGTTGLKKTVRDNSIWITQATVKLNILFGVLSFLAVTFGGLIITLIWEILTHKITLGF